MRKDPMGYQPFDRAPLCSFDLCSFRWHALNNAIQRLHNRLTKSTNPPNQLHINTTYQSIPT